MMRSGPQHREQHGACDHEDTESKQVYPPAPDQKISKRPTFDKNGKPSDEICDDPLWKTFAFGFEVCEHAQQPTILGKFALAGATVIEVRKKDARG